MRLAAFVFAAFAFAAPALAMDGTNVDTGDVYTVDDSTTFKVGDVLSMFNADGEEVNAEVKAVKETDKAWEVDVVDQDSGDSSTIEFTK